MDFFYVLPTMFSKTTISKIKVIISDGDAQEYHQIDHAINLLCPHVKEVGIGMDLHPITSAMTN